jgi:hypothetical protein
VITPDFYNLGSLMAVILKIESTLIVQSEEFVLNIKVGEVIFLPLL